MTSPAPAEPYWLQQQAVNAAAVAIAVRMWQQSGGDPARWAAVLAFVVATIMRAQAAAVTAAPPYIAATLIDLGIDAPSAAVIDPLPLIGVTGNGLPLARLYAGLPEQLGLHAAQAVARRDDDPTPAALRPAPTPAEVRELPPQIFQEAMNATTDQFASHVQTTISDTGRDAESLEIAARPGIGYVRMLNPPSCKRCVVLAGKFYRWNAGFKRHPNCDCRHIPAPESVADDLTVDPDAYFRSLSEAEQDAAFTKAGAQAIRDGADISQVVNAGKGMRVAQVYGQWLKITTQGVTKRGRAGRAIRTRGRDPATTPRLMPSSIYKIAASRDDALRLLKLNGYIAESSSRIRDIDALMSAATA